MQLPHPFESVAMQLPHPFESVAMQLPHPFESVAMQLPHPFESVDTLPYICATVLAAQSLTTYVCIDKINVSLLWERRFGKFFLNVYISAFIVDDHQLYTEILGHPLDLDGE